MVNTLRSRRSRWIRPVAASAASVTALGLVGVGVGVAAAPAAWAGTCSSKTGGSSNTLMWTGSSYTCAYEADNGNNKISSWATEFFTSSTAAGFEKRYNCQRQSGGVTVTYVYTNSGGTGIGSSITYTAFNSEDGSRHWTAAVLWNTPQGGSAASTQYIASCSNYRIDANFFYISKASMTGPSTAAAGAPVPFTVTVTAPDGGGTPSGTVALFRQSGDKPSPAGKNCDGTPNGGVDTAVGQAALSSTGTATLNAPGMPDGTYKYYAAYTGKPVTGSGLPGYCLTAPQSGLTPSQSATATLTVGSAPASPVDTVPTAVKATRALVVARASVSTFVSVVEQRGEGDLSVKCPIGEAPQTIYAGSDKVTFSPKRLTPRDGDRGVNLSGYEGIDAILQVTCRPRTAQAVVVGKIGRGSIGPDRLVTVQGGSVISGGLGDDHLIARHAKTALDGGFGNDRLTVRANGGGANGGFGNDQLEARGSGTILNGGVGFDTFTTGLEVAYVNARDGRGGDIVNCGSSKTKVRADEGDILLGGCSVV